jgi:hypothetical protein
MGRRSVGFGSGFARMVAAKEAGDRESPAVEEQDGHEKRECRPQRGGT